MFFIPAFGGWGGLFPIAALLAGVTILVLLGGWSPREPIQRRPGATVDVPSVVFWVTAVPVTIGIVFLALVLLVPILFAILGSASGFWFGAVAV